MQQPQRLLRGVTHDDVVRELPQVFASEDEAAGRMTTLECADDLCLLSFAATHTETIAGRADFAMPRR